MHRNLCALRADAYAESQPISVTAGKTYRFQTWVKQQLGGGTALHRLAFYNSSDVLVKRVNLSGSARQLPTAWSISSGWEKFSGLVAAPTGSSYVLLEVAADHIDGYVYFDDVTLEEFVPEATITRSAYGLAGQLIATRVSGDPVSGNNGLFYFHTDHLGSATFLTYGNGHASEGLKVANSTKLFTPFGEYRINPPNPPADITDRGFTGHKHNDEIGLIYMNARYYLPSVGRFVSADTIVPNPADPQDFNRYSYVRNNPLNLVDPSGHQYENLEGGCTESPQECEETQQEWLETINPFEQEMPNDNGGDDYAQWTWNQLMYCLQAHCDPTLIEGLHKEVGPYLQRGWEPKGYWAEGIFSNWKEWLLLDPGQVMMLLFANLIGDEISREQNQGFMNPNSIYFSQRTVSKKAYQYQYDMIMDQWDWTMSGPIRVMKIGDNFVAYDNRRLLAAQGAGLSDVPVFIVNANDIMPGSNMTWQQAYTTRFNHEWNVAAGGPVPPTGLPTQPFILPGND